MEALFLKLLNMSISASWLVLAVVVLRFALKKAPKSVRCVLWGLVGIRLVWPFSFESVLSLIPSRETVPPEIVYARQPAIDSGVAVIDRVVNPVITSSFAPSGEITSVNPIQIWLFLGAVIWIVGMAAMVIYALVSYLRLCRKVSASVNARENIWICDYIDTPFILGILKPRIYLPSAMKPESIVHVLAHERAHLKRHDHWWKPLGFLLLTVHWFNPVMWAAYILLCRDIELACDERVIQELNPEKKKAYSEALLSCSVPRRLIAACPLAFGEVGVKERVKSVLNYKKPAFWLMVAALIACVVVAVCFLTDPVEPEPTEPTEIMETTGANEPGQLTLEDVRRLAQKGNDLSWEDFADYPYTDIGSGLYIHEYKIDEVFSLRIGGVPSVEPMYIRLTAGEEYVDIRTDDVDAFIEKHQTAANSAVAGIAHGNASVYLQIPEGWEYETVSNEDMSEFGIAFWPEGYIKGQVKLMFMEQGFGVCGTGLETKEIDGLPGGVGYYWDGNPEWTFITFPNAPGAYMAMTEAADEWWPEYEDQVIEILATAELGRGIVGKDEAIAAATPLYGRPFVNAQAVFDSETGVWKVYIYEYLYDSSPRMTVLVDAKGNAVDSYGWGILPTATDVSSTGLTLNCVQSFGTAKGELTTEQLYWLERWNGTVWELVPTVIEDYAWTMEGWVIPKNETTSWKVNWEWLYGELPAGTYRIGKSISDFERPGVSESQKYYADFEVVEPIDDVGEMETGEVLDVIIASDPLNSNPGGYIEACPEEYKFLTEEQPEETLRYCFEEFLKGGQTDLRGVIMGEICKDIIAQRGETLKSDYFTFPGQEWFDKYLDYAISKSAEVSEEEMQKHYPTPWLLYSLTLRSEPKTE